MINPIRLFTGTEKEFVMIILTGVALPDIVNYSKSLRQILRQKG